MEQEMKRKLLVLGFDGATFDLIEPFRKKGVLPNFTRIMEGGAWAPLISVIPPVSAPAWVSISTGKNPGKHNIYGFTDGRGNIVNSTFRKAKAIWNLLDEQRKKSIIINIPVTYPPETINGAIYPGILDPDEKVYHGRFQIDKEALMERKKALEKTFQWEFKKTEKALRYMKEQEWDFFFILYFLSDFVPTIYWKYMDPNHPQHIHDPDLSQAIEKSYTVLDEILGRFLSLMDEQTDLVVISDHGIGPSKKVLNINEWLRQNGFLTLKMEQYEKALSPEKVARFLENHKIVGKLVMVFPDSLLKGAYRLVFKRSRNLQSRMRGDTMAYAHSHAHFATIWLPQKNDEILNDLEMKIKELKDPETGERIITRIYRREELFHGPFANNGPDLVLEALPHYSMRSQRIGNLFAEPIQSGDHRMNGIFIAHGPHVKKGTLQEISIFDACPTFLTLLGLPVPQDMDGRTLTEFVGAVQKTKASDTERDLQQEFYSKKEEEKIKKRL
ncbi:MAG: alkaline phosphatase family protein, partial [Theionarchaea archaeon]|nr:alkaline phosphatase family protein [Theionarchaea archaeon]